MGEFQITFEFEEDSPRVRAPELKATWARLEMRAGEECITKVSRSENIRSGIYVPLYPVAEWIVANWWFLWNEWRENASRHNMLAAQEGFALPDLTVGSTETIVKLAWRQSRPSLSSVRFLSQGSVDVPKDLVREQFRRVVEGVLERLSARKLDSRLSEDWAAIQECEGDPEKRAFCESAALLGCDPFAIDDGVACSLEGLGRRMPQSMLGDFCDSVPADSLTTTAETVRSFVDTAAQSTPSEGDWKKVAESVGQLSSAIAWNDGYRLARELRSFLGASGPHSCLNAEIDVRGHD